MPASAHLTPPWLGDLTERERAGLDPGVGADLLRTPDLLVIGGGMVGVATAAAFARARMGSVVLIERSRIASGTTGGAAGLLIPDAHQGSDPDHFVDLGRSSLGLWHRLHEETPHGVGLVEMDWIGLEPHPPEFAADRPAACERLSADAIADLLPALARPVPGVRLRQARVNPVLAAANLVGSLPPTATVATGVTAQFVAIDGGRIVRVETSAGWFSPGSVVFATGEPPVVDGLTLDLPSRRVKGHLLLVRQPDLTWPGSVAGLGTSIGDRRLLLGGTLDPADRSPDVQRRVLADIRTAVERRVPAAEAAIATHAWCCFRPAHPDDLPVVDRVPSLDNAWITSGHYRTGILMAPATADALITWITTDRVPAAVRELSAGRFARTDSDTHLPAPEHPSDGY